MIARDGFDFVPPDWEIVQRWRAFEYRHGFAAGAAVVVVLMALIELLRAVLDWL